MSRPQNVAALDLHPACEDCDSDDRGGHRRVKGLQRDQGDGKNWRFFARNPRVHDVVVLNLNLSPVPARRSERLHSQ